MKTEIGQNGGSSNKYRWTEAWNLWEWSGWGEYMYQVKTEMKIMELINYR